MTKPRILPVYEFINDGLPGCMDIHCASNMTPKLSYAEYGAKRILHQELSQVIEEAVAAVPNRPE